MKENLNEKAEFEGFDHHDPTSVKNPYPFYASARERCPIIHTDKYGGFWLLTRHSDVRNSAIDWHTFSSAKVNATAIPSTHERNEPDLPIELDPPDHTKYRSLVSPVFRRRRLEDLRPALAAHARELIAGLVEKREVDLVADFAQPMSVASLANFMDMADENFTQWTEWIARMFNSLANPEDARRATEEMYSYIELLITERSTSPRRDFISLLLRSEIDGTPLSEADVRAFCRIMLIAGHETTASAMGQTLGRIGSTPGLLNDLRSMGQDALGVAVEEFIRLASPVQLLARDVTTDTTIGGCQIKKGETVALGYGAANRDPDIFVQPDACQMDRYPNPHLAFGIGPHLCLGAHLARLEITVMLEALVALVGSLKVEPESITWKPRGDNRGPARIPATVEPAPQPGH